MCSVLTTIVEIVLGELGGPVDKVAEVGQQLRVGLQHQVLPLEVGVLALRTGVHQVEPSHVRRFHQEESKNFEGMEKV